ncbi:MAG: NUDIX hydrolase [Patescibacteria group bacterium]
MEFINLLVFNLEKTKILAVKRSQNDLDFGGMWALPGGRVEKESLWKAARRELYEETGLQLKRMSSKNFFSANPILRGIMINIIVRIAEIENYSPKSWDKDIEKVDWIIPQKLIQSFKSFDISDKEIQNFKSKLFLERKVNVKF